MVIDRPRLAGAALVGADRSPPLAVPFQYNPDKITRSIAPRAQEGEGSVADAVRFAGAPVETIALQAVFDAADGIATGDPSATSLGVLPRLSALELLAYPASADVLAAASLAAAGSLEIVHPAAPVLVLAWGAGRSVPVRIESFEIEESVHDPALNPIHVVVDLKLRVLSYSDVPSTHPAYPLFVAYQQAKERWGAAGVAPGWRP